MLSFSLVSLKIFIKLTTKSLLSVIDYESSKKHTDTVLLIKNKKQFCTVDHSARYSMKSAAKCEKAMRIAEHLEHE